MVTDGILKEICTCFDEGASHAAPPFKSFAYTHFIQHLEGSIALDQAIAYTQRDTRHYAKRQLTWFKKEPNVHWIDPTTHQTKNLIGPIQAFLANDTVPHSIK